MRFKAPVGTSTYDKLNAVMDKINNCRSEVKKVLDEFGAKRYMSSIRGVAGGIGAIEFDAKPTGWRSAYNHSQDNFYYPKKTKANKDLIARFEALPVVTQEEINGTVGFNAEYFATIGVFHRPDYILFEIPQQRINGEDLPYTYQPPADVVELTYTEFESLKRRIEEESEV